MTVIVGLVAFLLGFAAGVLYHEIRDDFDDPSQR
jgi:hypothetical protein